jgi:hypothetical protein
VTRQNNPNKTNKTNKTADKDKEKGDERGAST